MIEIFFRLYQHLLPRAQAWTIVIEKFLRKFFEGLTSWPQDVLNFFALILLDLFPALTRQLDLWEKQFGLITQLDDETARRDRLDAQWKAVGGQSPGYIQGILRDAGFDVYVHEWWFLDQVYDEAIICGNPLAVCGSPDAYAGNMTNQALVPRDPRLWIDSDSVLVNKIKYVKKLFTAPVICGNANAICGGVGSYSGAFTGIEFRIRKYQITDDPDTWVHYWYVGGVNFGDFADVPVERKDEFETLILQIKPRQTWVGLFINYV